MTNRDFKYELFFELSPDLLCIAGFDGYFKKVNSAVARTLGYTFEELYSRPINDFVHPDDKDVTAKVRQELTRSKPLMNFENKYITKGGEIVWLSWTSLPVESDEVIFAIAKNVTYRKRLEADRNALLANLTRKNRDLLELNFATSDDLKSPVNSLLALFELIDLSKIDDKETVQLMEVLQYVGEKVRKTLNTHVDELTRKSTEETGAERVDFQNALDETLQSIATIIQTSKTTILSDFTKLPQVSFSKSYLRSIYLNLITNAIKYASPDRPPVINISSDLSNGMKQLVVSDNGSGFDAVKVKDEIFDFPEKFHNNPNSKGIGLYLVHSHVSAFGGKVDIQSKLDVGTKVVITFR